MGLKKPKPGELAPWEAGSVFGRYPELRMLFLKHLARYGNIAAAAKHIRLGSHVVKDYRKKYPGFAQNIKDALDEHNAKIDKAIHDRAIEGWDEPRFGQSGVVGTVRRYSDNLLLAYARRHMKEYREGQHTLNVRTQHDVNHEVNLNHKVDLTQLSTEQRNALRLLLGKEETEEIKPAPFALIEAEDKPEDKNGVVE